MTGTLTVLDKNDGRPSDRGAIAVYEWEWMTTSGGAFSESVGNLNGTIIAVETDPDGDAVPASYAVTLKDAWAHDALEGTITGRSTSAVEIVYPTIAGSAANSTDIQTVVAGNYTLNVTSAGNSKKGKIKIFLK